MLQVHSLKVVDQVKKETHAKHSLRLWIFINSKIIGRKLS